MTLSEALGWYKNKWAAYIEVSRADHARLVGRLMHVSDRDIVIEATGSGHHVIVPDNEISSLFLRWNVIPERGGCPDAAQSPRVFEHRVTRQPDGSFDVCQL